MERTRTGQVAKHRERPRSDDRSFEWQFSNTSPAQKERSSRDLSGGRHHYDQCDVSKVRDSFHGAMSGPLRGSPSSFMARKKLSGRCLLFPGPRSRRAATVSGFGVARSSRRLRTPPNYCVYVVKHSSTVSVPGVRLTVSPSSPVNVAITVSVLEMPVQVLPPGRTTVPGELQNWASNWHV